MRFPDGLASWASQQMRKGVRLDGETKVANRDGNQGRPMRHSLEPAQRTGDAGGVPSPAPARNSPRGELGALLMISRGEFKCDETSPSGQ